MFAYSASNKKVVKNESIQLHVIMYFNYINNAVQKDEGH